LRFEIFSASGKHRKLTDEELIPLIHAGNVSAFNELFNRYGQRLYCYFVKMLDRNEEKAKDFLQDLFLKLIEKLHYFDAGRNFSHWIYKIATNMCLNEYKVQKNKHSKSGVEVWSVANQKVAAYDPNVEQQIDKEKFQLCLSQELEKVNPETRSIFLLRFQENCSIKAISQIMSLPEGTIKSRLFYTIKKLAQNLHHFNPLA
jgi:RNA polymerase sigma-70 factor (ECF subfamily)